MPAARRQNTVSKPAPANGTIRASGLALVFAVLWAAAPVTAQTFCSEPVEPYCATSTEPFSDALQYKRCKEDLARYAEKISEYESCITAKVDGLKDNLENLKTELERRGETVRP